MFGRVGVWRALLAALILGTPSGASGGENGVWSVSKATGEVWVATNGAQQVSLNQEEALKPGDTIRTGRNGRVLLVRGEETILISPNSVVGLPAEKKEGLSTTIIQRAGSILLESRSATSSISRSRRPTSPPSSRERSSASRWVRAAPRSACSAAKLKFPTSRRDRSRRSCRGKWPPSSNMASLVSA